MSASFNYDVDPARDLVRLTMSGFFHRQDILALTTARAEAYRQLDCAPNAHVTLIDVRGLKIQSQESMDAFGAMLGVREYRSRRLALVLAQTLARTQVERVLASRPGVAGFSDPAAALAWLLEDEADQEPRRRAVG
jgi:hypothetical protein